MCFFVDFVIFLVLNLLNLKGIFMDKKDILEKKKKQLALNVPMTEELMNRVEKASSGMHVGKAAYARIALEEKLRRDEAKDK